jgi:hypothetical protein
MIKKLYWMNNSSKAKLHSKISENLPYYISGEFEEFKDNEWQQKEILEYDDSQLSQLGGNTSDDLNDTLIIFDTFKNLPPIFATHMNVWIPLIHMDLLAYTRTRWFKDHKEDSLKKQISTHVFKGGINGYRDDNAVGRLWWTGYIGSRMAGSNSTNDIKEVLQPLMRTTDTRLNTIERSTIFSETHLAASISRYIKEGKFPAHTDGQEFRKFMININYKSNGRYFGGMTTKDMDNFLKTCHT